MNKLLLIFLILICSYLFGNSNIESNKKKNSKGEVFIFSAVKGNISLKGVGLQGVKLTRTYPELGKTEDIEQTTYTNENGDYYFDEVKGKLGIMRFLPHEAVIHQTIHAYYLDKQVLVWYTCKRNYNPLGEFKYYKYEPILSPEMSKAYNEGYIEINCDLENTKDIVQRVNDNIAVISISDFKFPYELALDNYAQELVNREKEFTNEISRWFENNPDYISRQLDNEENLSEFELEAFKPYFGVIIKGVESITYSDHIRLSYFEDDYIQNSQRVTISGDILLNIINKKGEHLGARVWLSEALFKVSKDNIILEAQDHYFRINPSNIDPNVID